MRNRPQAIAPTPTLGLFIDGIEIYIEQEQEIELQQLGDGNRDQIGPVNIALRINYNCNKGLSA